MNWREARSWLCCAGVSLSLKGELLDFAAALQNGVILCDLVNMVAPGCIDHFHRDAANVQVSDGECFFFFFFFSLSKNKRNFETEK